MKIAEIRRGYSYTRDLPRNYENKDCFRFESIQECAVSEAFLVQLQEISISQYYIFSGSKILEDFCLPIQRRGKVGVWKQWLKSQIFPKASISDAIWISDLWSKNYFHWVLECLPRLFALKNFGIKSPLMIPEHIYKTSYIKESLGELGIDVLTISLRQKVYVSSLFAVSHDSPCAFDPAYLNEVVQKFNQLDLSKKIVPFRKVYISRKEASKRRIRNEVELISLISSFGFEVVQMEKLSFKEQRVLMRETCVLLSVHGAGLTNLIFMPDGSKVIELHPDVSRYNSCFYNLAAAMSRDYYYSFESATDPNPQKADIFVDLQRMDELLNSL